MTARTTPSPSRRLMDSWVRKRQSPRRRLVRVIVLPRQCTRKTSLARRHFKKPIATDPARHGIKARAPRRDAALCISRRLFLHIGFPLTECSEPVHLCTMRKGTLGGGDILALAFPCGLRRMLKRAAI